MASDAKTELWSANVLKFLLSQQCFFVSGHFLSCLNSLSQRLETYKLSRMSKFECESPIRIPTTICKDFITHHKGMVLQESEMEYFLQGQNRIFIIMVSICNSQTASTPIYRDCATWAPTHILNHNVISLPQQHHYWAAMEYRVNFLIKSRRSYYFWDRLDCPRSVAPMALGF